MRISLLLCFLFVSKFCIAQQFPLYPGKIPNSKNVSDEEERKGNAEVDSLAFKVSIPTITVFLAPKGKGTSVIIFPGGGYGGLLTKREGSDVARAFNKLGVNAFVVKYRLPSDRTMDDKSIGPLQDAQQAIKMVREKAKEWNIDPQKIGIMGYSAGGHLAATAGTHFETSYISNIEKTSLRPDFMLLINPVISFTDSIGHTGSRKNLIGENPAKEQIRLFSNEYHISKTTPPTFLVHAGTDVVVPVANSLVFYQNLKRYGISGEIHIYSKGEHGFLTYPSFDEWFGRCVNWMKSMELVP